MTPNEIPAWLRQRILPEGISLEVLDTNQCVVFSHSGKWLYPLLDLEQFLAEHPVDVKNLYVHDRVTGRAAAALTVRMGFTNVKSLLLSMPALRLFESYSVCYGYDTLVELIACKTERLIDDSMDLDTIHGLIASRVTARC